MADEGGVRVVRVAGRLTDAHASALLAACAGSPGPLRVDLSDLSSVDTVAAEVLRRLRDEGAEFAGVPRYILFTLAAVPPHR